MMGAKQSDFMAVALEEARKCLQSGDVPVGAVIVKDGAVIARGRNRREQQGDAVLHAEIEAIRNACAVLGGWRLSGCSMYVTLEPCPMCAGAIINSRIDSVFFGAYDLKGGAVDSVVRLFDLPFNHHVEYYGGICEIQCADILSEFFSDKR